MKKYLLLFALLLSIITNAQTNFVRLRSAKQVLPLFMHDLSQKSSYNNFINKLGYHITGKSNEGNPIYTHNDGDYIIYDDVKEHDTYGNEITKFSMMYFSREMDNLESVLSYLDDYYNSELYGGYALETEDSHDEEFYFSKRKSDILEYLKNEENIIFDTGKYFIKERGDKNTIERGIKLIKKYEGGVEKSYYIAFVNIEQVGYDQTSQESKVSEKDLSDEYKENEFQGEEEVELVAPMVTSEELIQSKKGWLEDGNSRHWKFFSNHSASLNGSKPTYKWSLSIDKKDTMLKISNNEKTILNARILWADSISFTLKDKNGKQISMLMMF